MGTGRSTTDLSGQVIKGYQLHRRIGVGRFGVVYHASQPQVHRDVAIKVIEPEYANHPEFVRTFETEAQLVARLEHIHIVPLYDYWREPDRAFLVMRWLRGGNLRDSLVTNGPWPVDAVVRLLDQLTSALALAHRRGVVHRDIKPDNVLLDEENNALLTDFGIATTVMSQRPTTPKEKEGLLLGTPAYMAPELFTGDPGTSQSDIYALGILLYEVLTNTRPFADDTAENLMRQHLSAPVPNLQVSGLPIPHELNIVTWRAMAKSPEARYQSVAELAAAFRAAAMPTPDRPQPASHIVQPTTDADTEVVGTKIIEPLPLENPYKGLRPFEQADAADFFGRDQLVDQLLDLVRDEGSRFLALIGPSGSGKSSAVKAGLIPALRAGKLTDAQDWFTVEMVPGPEPIRELEAALQRIAVNPVNGVFDRLTADSLGLAHIVEQILPQDRPTRLLLLIDQFEEVFTLVEDEAARRQFLSLLNAAVEAADRLFVVITLRADFYDRPLLYEGFSALIRKCSEVILPLSAMELKSAIENPAARLGLMVQPELVTAIIAEVSQQPGALPLLQYALTEVFERSNGRLLTLEAYREVGGLTAALARRAEDIYSGMDPTSQALTRQLFLRLVSLQEEAETTRRRLNWSTLTTLSDDQALIEKIRDTFVKARLLTMDHDPKTREPTVEVAHEALLREWNRLDEWMDSSREDIHMQRRLNVVASEWQQAGRDAGYLLTSTRLIQFEEWASSGNFQLTREEREFLEASLAERRARQATERARLKREKLLERRTRNRLQILVAVFATATVAGILLARFALSQQKVAEDRLHEIQLLALTDQAGLALDDDNPELALALLSTIDDLTEILPVPTRQMNYRAAYTPGTRLVLDHHNDSVISVAISPDGRLAASGSGRINPIGPKVDNALSIWDPMTGEELFHLTAADNGPDDTVTGTAFSPDGKLLAAGSADRSITLWDVETGTLVRRLEGHQDWVARVAFTPDGQTLISTSGNFLLTALPIPTLGTADSSVRAWDVDTGEQIRIFGGEDGGGHAAPVMSVAISPDGQTVVTGDADGVIIVWDIVTGEEILRTASPGDWVSSLAFTPDGGTFLAGLGKPSIGGSGASSTLMALWDLETGSRLRDYIGHTNVVISVAVSPDGRTALSASADASLRLWDIETGTELQRFTGHGDWVFGVAISPDGRWAITGATDGMLRVWDIEPGNLLQRFDTAILSHLLTVDLSRDAAIALSGHENGRVTLWDVATGEEIRRFEVDTDRIYTVALSPDNHFAVAGDHDGTVTLWDIETGAVVQQFEGHSNPVLDVNFSPDGSRLVTASGNPQITDSGDDMSARIWDVTTGEEIQCYIHPDSVWSADFSPDGQQVVSSSGPIFDTGSHVILVWDAATGEEIARMTEHEDVASGVAFSADGQSVVSGSDDSTVRLWDADTGQEIRRFEGHTGFINRVILQPAGDVILSGSDDNTIRLWDRETGEELYRIDEHGDTILDMVLSGNGRQLLALSDNNVMILWRIDHDLTDLAEWLETNRYIRDLTCVERETYRIEPTCE